MPQDISSLLRAGFAPALTATLGSVTGKPFEQVQPAGSTHAARELTVWQQQIGPRPGKPQGTLNLATGADFSRAAGNMMLEAAGVANSSAEDIRAAWRQVAGQIFEHLIENVSAQLGCQLTLSPGNEVPYDAAMQWNEIAVQGPGSVYRVFFAGLTESAAEHWDERLAPSGGDAGAAAPAASIAPGYGVAGSGTYDLLLDVALPVAVSFGRTSLQIREVLKLNSGSIIELNRLVSEPVDVVVNESVIARGEVVVVDGNYGVRITQIASREDRIRTGMSGAGVIGSGVAGSGVAA